MVRWQLPMAAGMVLAWCAASGAEAGEIYDAAIADNLALVQSLVANGADVNEQGDEGTPLHAAVLQGDISIAAFLLDKGADIEAPKAPAGYKPLHIAASYGKPEMVAFLLERGAQANGRDFDERTPLHLVARLGYAKIAKLLIDSGADVDAVDGHAKHTALHSAILTDKKDIVILLLDHSADVNAAPTGESPLHLAAREGSPEIVELLVERGADLSARTLGMTPLMIAESTGRSEVGALLRAHGARE